MPDNPAPLSKLPPRCFAQLPSTGETIAIICGEAGYHPVVTVQTVEQLNASLPQPPTPEQVEALLVGSIFGWHVPAARLFDAPVDEAAAGTAAAEADALAPGLVVADWGEPDTPFQLVGCNPVRPGTSRSLDRLWTHAGGHLGFYGWLRVVNRRMDRVYLCELFELPARDWRDEYEGRVPPVEAVDVAIDEYASKHGTGPALASPWTRSGR